MFVCFFSVSKFPDVCIHVFFFFFLHLMMLIQKQMRPSLKTQLLLVISFLSVSSLSALKHNKKFTNTLLCYEHCLGTRGLCMCALVLVCVGGNMHGSGSGHGWMGGSAYVFCSCSELHPAASLAPSTPRYRLFSLTNQQ